MGIRIAVIEPGRDPYQIEIEPEDREGREASYLSAYQRAVDGLIEVYPVLWGDEPLLYTNEEMLYNGSQPNRAIYYNERMAEERYLSQMDFSTVGKPGDLYGVIFGTFIAVSYDTETDTARDMPEDEWQKVCETFGGIYSVFSGMLEVRRIRADKCTEHIKVNLPNSSEAYARGNGEGVWVLVDERTKKAHDSDATSGVYFGILDNDSMYYPGLSHGEPIPFEMRGDKRPVTPFAWLVEWAARHE